MVNKKELKTIRKFNLFNLNGFFRISKKDHFFKKKSFLVSSNKPFIKDIWSLLNLFEKYSSNASVCLCITSDEFNKISKFIESYNCLHSKLKVLLIPEETLKESLYNKEISSILSFISDNKIERFASKELTYIFKEFIDGKLFLLSNLINKNINDFQSDKLQQEEIKIGIIVHARMSSKRLPGKAMLKINNQPVVSMILSRFALKYGQENVFFSTSLNKADDEMSKYVKNKGYKVYRGDEDNLVKRFIDISINEKLTHVVRVTGDDLFRNLESLDSMFAQMIANDCDYIFSDDLILGCNSEIMNLESLLFIQEFASDINQTHALTWFLDRKDIFKINEFTHNFSQRYAISLMLDEPKDFKTFSEFLRINHSFFSSNWSYYELINKINNSLEIFDYYPLDLGLSNRDKIKYSFLFDNS